MKKWYIAVGVIILLIIALGYYAISPLFRNIKVDDALPPTNIGQESESSPTATVTGTAGHPASGTVRIIEAEGASYLRYENFKTINGPDIYVYLAKDLDAKEFINIGKVKATEGNINYEIPEGVNLDEYHYVLTWCKTFGVLFNSADLTGIETE
ncbi:DM13 domain-containing protein [Candidatus Parcubacteria bacterium]|uniref:DM13 domain-containing protein n=1 Tax=Candidatus Kaiserbacteria bacterium CG10_big_fil_rev_8_21_14_0_10_47_16 TaxID=1974608 RepID=A0A2H0UD81_9BACT|nr:DM13 domain-containing protein [Candidatus Parcubacteria bacterium]PIR84351.1 MAG: hypothetical protein COU16_02035 [Candidatus Kaiserbacteria bacterium CG10_big_fil_rev_8_21_14_0_10_47_16]